MGGERLEVDSSSKDILLTRRWDMSMGDELWRWTFPDERLTIKRMPEAVQ